MREILLAYFAIGALLVFAAACVGAIKKTYLEKRARGGSAASAGIYVLAGALFLIAFWPAAGVEALRGRR